MEKFIIIKDAWLKYKRERRKKQFRKICGHIIICGVKGLVLRLLNTKIALHPITLIPSSSKPFPFISHQNQIPSSPSLSLSISSLSLIPLGFPSPTTTMEAILINGKLLYHHPILLHRFLLLFLTAFSRHLPQRR